MNRKMRNTMSRKNLILPLCLSLAFVACEEASEENIKSSKNASPAVEKVTEIFKAKVRSAVGETEFLKSKSEAWKQLHVGQSVQDNDQIRTAKESEVILNTNDGTVFTISENSNVKFNTAFQDSVRGEINVFIRNGNIQFDVQKQKKNQINFNTGTATAAIRGTAGFVGSLDGQLVASLREGKVEVKDAKGRSSNITENQTILVTKSGEAKTIKLESSGSLALFAALENMVKTGGLENLDELEKSLQAFDAGYVEERNKFEQTLNFRPIAIPTAVRKPTITLEAKLTPGVFVTVMGITDTVPASGEYKRTFTWDEDAAGTKRFIAVCSDGNVEVSCNTWSTEYVNPNSAEAAEVVDTLSQADSVATADSSVAAVDSAAVDSAQAPAVEASAEPVKKPVARKPASVALPKPKFNLVIKLPSQDSPAMSDSLAADSLVVDTLETVKVPKRKKEVETDLKIMLSGIEEEELAKIDTIFIYRDGQLVEYMTELWDLVYMRKVTLNKKESARFEVVAKLRDGSDIRAHKTYVAN